MKYELTTYETQIVLGRIKEFERNIGTFSAPNKFEALNAYARSIGYSSFFDVPPNGKAITVKKL